MKLLITVFALSCIVLVVSSSPVFEENDKIYQEGKNVINKRYRRYDFGSFIDAAKQKATEFKDGAVETFEKTKNAIAEDPTVQEGLKKAEELKDSTLDNIKTIGGKIAADENVKEGLKKAGEIKDSVVESIVKTGETIAADENVQTGLKKGKEFTDSAVETAKDLGERISHMGEEKVTEKV